MIQLDAVSEMKAKAVREICIGIIAENIGTVNVSSLVKSGEEVFEFIRNMTYKQFRDIKKLKP